MGRDSNSDLFQPPRRGVRLLEAILPPSYADNELGDLEEEYRWKVQRDGLKGARRWFWIQVCRSLLIILKEGQIGAGLFIQVSRMCRQSVTLPTYAVSASRVAISLLAGTAFTVLILSTLISDDYTAQTMALRAEVARLREEQQILIERTNLTFEREKGGARKRALVPGRLELPERNRRDRTQQEGRLCTEIFKGKYPQPNSPKSDIFEKPYPKCVSPYPRIAVDDKPRMY